MENYVIVISLITGGLGLIGTLFTVYHYFRNPQINSEKNDIKLEDRIRNVEKQIVEVKETHIRTVEQDIKNLNVSINELSKTVVRLATIIDERIPRTQSN